MMLGLKRDLRTEGAGVMYPQESYRIAQELACDRYAECSAVTRELLREAFEDIARLAAETTMEGGLNRGACVVL
ncbi:Rho-like small GTPase [Aspergillus sclerotialis]|uniref:Rho-like small GTPase n=1 Tax=Aspergillus sclerotialis TaxID=2070753 RepID=A0A3A2ZR45_9EURO|nr:Rho-like small GTPase [Aspergillus sclerotialis]